jgi:putative ABC transport system permease protein
MAAWWATMPDRTLLLEAIRTSVEQIRAAPGRSFLTMLGVLIGTAAILAVAAIGDGAANKVALDIQALGPNLVTVTPGTDQRSGRGGPAPAFTPWDVADMRRAIRSARALSAAVERPIIASSNAAQADTTITGIDPSYFFVRHRHATYSPGFDDTVMASTQPACILGDTVARKLFGDTEPLRRTIRVGRQSCMVMGLLDVRGRTTIAEDQDDLILAPLAFVQQQIAGSRGISTIYLSATNHAAIAEIRWFLRARRGLRPGVHDDFKIEDSKDILRDAARISDTVNLFIVMVGAISLVVGGIGISNIMLVAAAERVEEIGLRQALGAEQGDILSQFVIEALIICGAGWALGAVAGALVSWLFCSLAGFPLHIGVTLICGSLVFALLIGLIFGYWPARRASSLDPIEALRHP